MSSLNFGQTLSDWFGALILTATGVTATDFSQLWLAILIANAFQIVPLFFVSFMDEKKLGLDAHGEPPVGADDEKPQERRKAPPSPPLSAIAAGDDDHDVSRPLLS
jgi:hypothetical protein